MSDRVPRLLLLDEWDLPCRKDEYAKLLSSQHLWPVDLVLEKDWSDRGQHARFEKNEQALLNSTLVFECNLGSTRSATVQAVSCRRILLARKNINCGKMTMTKEEAVKGVSHLTRFSHTHVLRVIGTYVQGRYLSILLYPVAGYNLAEFLDTILVSVSIGGFYGAMISAGDKALLLFKSCRGTYPRPADKTHGKQAAEHTGQAARL